MKIQYVLFDGSAYKPSSTSIFLMIIMKTEDILQLDCREKENKKIVQKVLRKIKPLSKCSEEIVPMEMLERVLRIIEKKYGYHIFMIFPDTYSSDDGIIWRAEVSSKKTDKISYNKNIYGITFYEVIAKSVIYMYSKVKGK